MRVMTWNVLWRFEPDWKRRQRGIVSTLLELRPDVLGIQECWATDDDSQAHMLACELGAHAVFAGPSLPPVPDPPEDADQAGVRMGVGLVSRWPVRIIGEHELPVSHRQIAPVALEAEIAAPHGPVRVIVAAVEWEPEFADDHLAQTSRLASLLGDTDPARPTILLADLNCDVTQPEFAPLADVADDAWARGGGETSAVTLSSQVPFAPLEATKEIDRRIDHVLLAPPGAFAVSSVAVWDGTVDGLYPSDHFPVIADVDPRRRAPSADGPDGGASSG